MDKQLFWDKLIGVLYFMDDSDTQHGVPIATVSRSNSIRTILSAFEEEGWPDSIFDPLKPKGLEPHHKRLSRTLYRWNLRAKGMSPQILFSVGSGGETIDVDFSGGATC